MIDYSGTSIDQYLESTEKFRDKLGDQSMIYNEETYKEDCKSKTFIKVNYKYP